MNNPTTFDEQMENKLAQLDASSQRFGRILREINEKLKVFVPRFLEELERSRESQNTQRSP